MSLSAQDLIASSLRLIGVLAQGEDATSNEANDALVVLNQLIDSWSTENLLIPNKVREVFPVVASKQTYTMGTGGDFDTSRPMRIENALIQLNSTTPAAEIPIKILTKDQYASIILKTLTSTFPLYLYSDDNFPLTNVNVWPVGTDTTNNIVLYSSKPLAELATLSATLSLPPGYERALRHALAVDLAPEYGRPVPDSVAAIAVESKSAIKRMNVKPMYLQVDQSLRAKPAVWNWMTGDPT